MHKQLLIERSGSEIRVINSWTGGAKLYIDGDMKDFNNDRLVTKKFACLSGSFVNHRGNREVVEVYAKSGLFGVGFLVLSNGEEILRDKY